MRKKIDRLTIKGFKSIRDLSNFSLGDINIVVGANGAGKSNFVQMFRMVREWCGKTSRTSSPRMVARRPFCITV